MSLEKMWGRFGDVATKIMKQWETKVLSAIYAKYITGNRGAIDNGR